MADNSVLPATGETYAAKDRAGVKHQRVIAEIEAPLSAFGDLRVVELSPVLQVSFESTVSNTEIGTIEVTNSGAVTQSDAMCVVNTGVTTSSTAEWETSKHVKYKAGMGGLMRFTALFTAGVAGTEQSVGLADTEGVGSSHENGFAVGYDGTTFGFMRWRDDTLIHVAQSSWDDPMDGTGDSGMTLDPTKLNVYFIQFQYLGAGAIKLWIEDDATGNIVLAHTVLYANLFTVPSIYNPNFHMMVHAINGATTTDIITKSASMGFFVEGKTKHTEIQQPSFSSGEKSVAILAASEAAIFTIRNKSTYAGKNNFLDIVIQKISGSIEAGTANNLGSLRFVKNATLGGTPAYTDIDTTDSIVEIDVAGTTVTGGKTLDSISFAGKNDRISEGNLTPYDFILSPNDTVTLVGASTAAATIKASLLWKELF